MPNYEGGKAPWSNYQTIRAVVIETGVTNIGDYAFAYCRNLATITIPKSVTNISVLAFRHCQGLLSIDVENGNNTYTSKDGVLFDKDKTTLILCPAGKKDAYVIPHGVKNIGIFAFIQCNSLTSLTIPSSVSSVHILAFWASSSPISIEVERKNKTYTSENGVLFNKRKTTIIRCPVGKKGDYVLPNSVTCIEEYAFASCGNLTSIALPNSVKNIGQAAFGGCSSLTSFVIPPKIKHVSHQAFVACKSLTSIIIPNNVSSIGSLAFVSCTSLTSVTILNPIPIDINSNVFDGLRQSSCTLNVPKESVSVYQSAEVWKEFNVVGIEE
jgi:hypothetical protein